MAWNPSQHPQDLIAFRDAVAADVAAQYPRVDYVAAVVASAIERHATLLGLTWYVDGPRPNDERKAVRCPIEAVYERFKHLDKVFEMVSDTDGTDDTDPFHATARDLWRAVKASLGGDL